MLKLTERLLSTHGSTEDNNKFSNNQKDALLILKFYYNESVNNFLILEINFEY
jgi:hypothetical protein